MATLAMINARINPQVKALADKWCKAQGLVFAKFVEEAILDKLEEYGDKEELSKLRREPTRPFRDVLKELKSLK